MKGSYFDWTNARNFFLTISSSLCVLLLLFLATFRHCGYRGNSRSRGVAHVDTMNTCWQKTLHWSCLGTSSSTWTYVYGEPFNVLKKVPVPSTKIANFRFLLHRRQSRNSTCTCNATPLPRFQTSAWKFLLKLCDKKNESHRDIRIPLSEQIVKDWDALFLLG